MNKFSIFFGLLRNLDPKLLTIKSLYPAPSVPYVKLRILNEFELFLELIIVDVELSEKISFVLKSFFLINFEYVSDVINNIFFAREGGV